MQHMILTFRSEQPSALPRLANDSLAGIDGALQVLPVLASLASRRNNVSVTDKKLFLTRLSSAPYLLEIRVLEPYSTAQTDSSAH